MKKIEKSNQLMLINTFEEKPVDNFDNFKIHIAKKKILEKPLTVKNEQNDKSLNSKVELLLLLKKLKQKK